MTNPNNAVGTNGAYGGRTSVNAFNDNLASYTAGILSGWACSPDSGMAVTLGGDGSTRDVAIAEDNAGNKTTINNISGSPIQVTISAAPGANSRIDAIVAYVDNPPQGSDNIADNYEACGLIAVDGTPSASPTAPDDNDIRSAITADGASGSTAYYVVLATVTVENGTTDIIADDIASGANARLNINNVGISYEIVGTTTGNINYAIKYADGRLTCYQRYTAANKSTSAWGNVYSADSLYTPQDYAVPFVTAPIVTATISGLGSGGLNVWLSADGGSAPGSTTKPHKYQVTRGSTGNNVGGTTIDIIAEGFWK